MYVYLDNDKEEILKSGKIKIKDLVCCFIIMENGEKDEKLKFLFELYDSDSNGFLDTKEVEYIIDRCIVVARYLGWDVKEIRPIIKKMIKSMDVNNDGMIKLDEWMKCGSETVPLLVLLGLEENMKDDGSHVWKLEHIKNNRICHVCEKYIDGFRKQAFVCKFCKYTSHDMCISNEAKNCIITYFKEIATKKSMAHHWVKGHYKNKCDACGKRLKNQLKCHACSWCNRQIHIDCTEMIHETCDLGDMSEMILSPAHVYPSYLNENHQSTCQIDSLNLEISNELTSEPVIVFINQKSGGQQGEKLHKKFIELLNPRQIFMIEKSPLQGAGQLDFLEIDFIFFEILAIDYTEI
ncbi:hypothetical protein A3Q56_02955 [Intoshia linei]|uniref:Uncharacterized protein n=1 Tax=Intoshia linei TaxID=1819745 RepID=A0A177B4U7_9BILA|nr:hypothetical protein A3Q56_02955 [Intoshia linei]